MYKVIIEKNVNGKHEFIEKNFESYEDFQAYMDQHGMTTERAPRMSLNERSELDDYINEIMNHRLAMEKNHADEYDDDDYYMGEEFEPSGEIDYAPYYEALENKEELESNLHTYRQELAHLQQIENQLIATGMKKGDKLMQKLDKDVEIIEAKIIETEAALSALYQEA